jgi:SAM-dependent methyltransferase
VQPKPRHLWADYGAQFGDASVVAAYDQRPPYPPETFAILRQLVGGPASAVVDLGCGRGDLARPMLAFAERVDAVDPSAAMLAAGRALPGGADPRLRWLHGTAEDAPLAGPYALATAGESAHWFDWERSFPRIRAALAPGAYLALVGRWRAAEPWDAALQAVINRYSTNRDFQPYDLLAELATRGLFRVVGAQRTPTRAFTQPVDAFIEALHSRNGFSRERMTPADAAACDAAIRQMLRDAGVGELVELHVAADVTWGEPAPAAAAPTLSSS